MTAMVRSALAGGGGGGGAFAVTASPDAVYGGRALPGSVTVTTEEATATPTGGTAPFTYSWAIVGGVLGPWSITNPAAATTRFACSGLAPLDSATADFICTVRDATTAPIDSNSVNATATNYGSGYL